MAKKPISADPVLIEDAETIDDASPGPDPDFPQMPNVPDSPAETPELPEPTHDEPQDAHRSIRSRLVSAAVIFLVGGAAALWAGPKIAPSLPSGLAPVARWLMPGQDAALLAIDAAKLEFAARVDAIPPALDAAAVDARIAEAVAPVEAALAARIGELESAPAPSDAQLEARLGELENRTAGVLAEMAALADQPVAAGAAPPSADLARLTARVAGLQARIDGVAAQFASLKQQVEGVATVAAANVAEAESEIAAAESEAAAIRQAAELQAALTSLAAAVAAGTPFAQELAAYSELAGSDAPSALAASSESGVPTMLALRETFPQAAHQAIRAAVMAEADTGIAARIGGFLQAQVATRSLTPQPGDGADAVLSRVEEALRNDDLATSLREAESLPAVAASAFAGWIADAKARLETGAALAALSPAVN